MIPEGILRRHLYGVFGSRSEYLDADEEEVLVQRLIWEGENEADKERTEREEAHRKKIEEKLNKK